MDPPLLKVCYPPYDDKLVEFSNKLFGMGGYWQGKNIYWIEPILLYILVLEKAEKEEEAKQVFEKVTILIEKYQGIFEVYEKKEGEFFPLKKAFYKAENPYARGAGLYIYTRSVLNP